jgi:DNA-binding PadR family transcriptional regulator
LSYLAKQPSQGYEIRARLNDALGSLGEALNAGHIYVVLGRLEKAGLVEVDGPANTREQERKVYVLTALGQERVSYNEKLWMLDLLKAVTYPPS